MFRPVTLVCVSIALALSACVSDVAQEKIAARRAAAAQVHKMAETPAAVQRTLSNTTTKVWGAHGTQIEYLGADGKTFLWYPGNRVAVAGQWKLQMASYGLEICFLYGQNSYNPLTRQSGGRWECDMAAYYILNRDEIVSGNPLRLSQKIPYVLPKGVNVSIDQAMRTAGFGPLKQKNMAPAPQYPSQQ